MFSNNQKFLFPPLISSDEFKNMNADSLSQTCNNSLIGMARSNDKTVQQSRILEVIDESAELKQDKSNDLRVNGGKMLYSNF